MFSIGVFGSSRPRAGDAPYEEARRVGRLIARRGARLVCGGYGGIMEAACRGAVEEGGTTVGVIFEATSPNDWVSESVAVRDLSERLVRLRDSAQAWIFLPHGLGTLLELAWMAESVVKQISPPRPLVLLGDFWRGAMDTMLAEAAGSGREALAGCVRWAKTENEAVDLALG